METLNKGINKAFSHNKNTDQKVTKNFHHPFMDYILTQKPKPAILKNMFTKQQKHHLE